MGKCFTNVVFKSIVISFVLIIFVFLNIGNEVCLKPFHLELMTSTLKGFTTIESFNLRQYEQK